MRTTVEIRDELLIRLREEAARRGTRGFSQLVEEALERYLGSDPARARRVKAALGARLTGGEADALDAHVKRLRKEWTR